MTEFTDTRRVAHKPTRRKLAEIDKAVEAAFYRRCAGIAINVMDIGSVFAAGRAAALAGGDVEAAVVDRVAQLQGGAR